jgi:hypothetical protein
LLFAKAAFSYSPVLKKNQHTKELKMMVSYVKVHVQNLKISVNFVGQSFARGS